MAGMWCRLSIRSTRRSRGRAAAMATRRAKGNRRACRTHLLLYRHLSPALSQPHARISRRRLLCLPRRATPPRERADQDHLWHRFGRGYRGDAKPAQEHAPSRRDRRQERPIFRADRRRCRQDARQRRRGDAVRRLQSLGPLIQLNSTHPLTGRRVAHLGSRPPIPSRLSFA
jgi:hypothetical protein